MRSAVPQAGRPDDVAALTAGALDPLFWRPTRLGVDSAWLAHVPFGHWLVAAHRPASIVELGTRSGVSFAAFCEAVLRCGIGARALAFDTRGANPADAPDKSATAELGQFLDQHYAAVATLLHRSPDEALDAVPDGSVDLLHINAVQRHEDVSGVFARWQVKLSPRAIVLVHATNRREDSGGADRFWSDAAAGRPHFAFFHADGLGMLAAGPAGAAVDGLCSLGDGDAATLRHRFATLGNQWAALRSLDRETDAVELPAELAARDARIAALLAETGRLAASLDAAHAELDAFSQELIAHEHERATFLKSTSWRITAPLRRLAGAKAQS